MRYAILELQSSDTVLVPFVSLDNVTMLGRCQIFVNKQMAIYHFCAQYKRAFLFNNPCIETVDMMCGDMEHDINKTGEYDYFEFTYRFVDIDHLSLLLRQSWERKYKH